MHVGIIKNFARGFVGGVFMFASFLALAADSGQTSTVTEALDDWAKITYPAEVSPGTPFEVEIELLKLDAPAKLSANLGYMKQNGKYGGMLKWGGAPKDVSGPGKNVWQFKFAAKPEMGNVVISVFLSPDGEWANRTKDASSKQIKAKLSSEPSM